MKIIFSLFAVMLFCCCNQPMEVTGRPNPQDATSGTLGSARSTNQMPPADTNRNVRDTLPSRDSL